MYGKNNLSNSKLRVLWTPSQRAKIISRELSTIAEVYTIDTYASGKIVTEGLSGLLGIAEESFDCTLLKPPQSLNSPSTKFALFWLE